ncbi:interleukin-10 isoform X1 [Brachyhypopomus gauderio]|uniref:interleukin-10 isoform X1 n=1 Tax=Brachyhypopomus gauderio TaxID=698409 RepID=UPI004041E9E4
MILLRALLPSLLTALLQMLRVCGGLPSQAESFTLLVLKDMRLSPLLLEFAECKRFNCKDKCCEFVEGFPVRLKALRSSYSEIRDYYEENDVIETALLNRTVLENVKSPYGCHVMKDILHFYLETVLPSAASEVKRHFKTPIDAIGNIFLELKRELVKCRSYFACQKPFEISTIQNSYNQMADKGLYKAMGELDLLFNYIEDYLASKRLNN